MKRCSPSVIIREMQIKTAIYNEISTHTSQNGHHQKNLQTINAGEGVERRQPACIVSGNVNWHNHYGKQCGDSFKNWKQNCHMIQQSHRWAHTQRKPELKETRVPNAHCSTVYNSQDTEAT